MALLALGLTNKAIKQYANTTHDSEHTQHMVGQPALSGILDLPYFLGVNHGTAK